MGSYLKKLHCGVWECGWGAVKGPGEWLFTGDDIVQLSKKHDCSVLFNIRKHDTNDTLLGEGIFLYDVTQGKAAYKTQVGTVFAVPTFTVSVSKISVIIPITAR